jgi:hypothetical protein
VKSYTNRASRCTGGRQRDLVLKNLRVDEVLATLLQVGPHKRALLQKEGIELVPFREDLVSEWTVSASIGARERACVYDNNEADTALLTPHRPLTCDRATAP